MDMVFDHWRNEFKLSINFHSLNLTISWESLALVSIYLCFIPHILQQLNEILSATSNAKALLLSDDALAVFAAIKDGLGYFTAVPS